MATITTEQMHGRKTNKQWEDEQIVDKALLTQWNSQVLLTMCIGDY